MAKGKERSNQDEEKVPTPSEALASTAAALTSAATALNSYASTSDDTQCEINPTEEGVLKLFREFKARRDGIVKALTTDVEIFYRICDPRRNILCLYGLTDGSWRVTTPVELVPPDMPEPAVGLNLIRDVWNRKEWLAEVAMQSDAWLYQTAFFNRHKLEDKSRKELFDMINSLPTIYEVVMEAAKKPSNESTPEKSSKREKSASELMPPAKRTPEA